VRIPVADLRKMYSPCAAPSFHFFCLGVANGVLAGGKTIKDAVWMLTTRLAASDCCDALFIAIGR
jgi:hypothetical protein